MLSVASAHHAHGILEIYAPIVQKTHISFEYEVPTITEMQERILKTRNDYPFVVDVNSSGKIVGYAYASRLRGRPAYDWTAELSVYVAKEAQGSGTGTKLYQALMNLLKVQQIRQVFGAIALPNEQSEKFHQKLGFNKVGVFDNVGFKKGKWYSIAFYQKDLQPDVEPKPFIKFCNIPEKQVNDLLT